MRSFQSPFLLSFLFLFIVQAYGAIDSLRFETLIDSARAFRKNTEQQEALPLLYSILDSLKQNPDDDASYFRQLSRTHKEIAWIYLFLNDRLSLSHADKALESAKASGDTPLIQKAYSLKYYCLYDLPGSAPELNRLADQCIHYALLLGDAKMLGEAYMHKCNALVELDSLIKAGIYCSKAEEVYRTLDDPYFLASVLGNIGNVFLKAGQAKKALAYHQKAFELSREIGYSDFIIDDLSNLANDYFLLGNYSEAARLYRAYSDSLVHKYERLLDEKFTEAEARYAGAVKDREIAMRELEISRQRAKRNKIIYGGLSLFLLLGSGFFGFALRQKRRKEKSEYELRKEREMNRQRSEFLENMAHEIRTPVTLIEGYLRMALEEAGDAERVRSRIQEALDSNKKIISDAEEILEFLRLDKGKIPLRKEDVDIRTFTKRLFFSFESLAASKGLTLLFKEEEDRPLTAFTDPGRFEKILSILISNAIKYAPSGSTVELRLWTEEEMLKISIKDEGPGIAAEEQEKIFERFYQSERISHGGGVGIGLALARELSKSIEARLTLQSRVGEGAVFTVSMHAKAAERAAANAVGQSKSTETKTRKAPVEALGNGKKRLLIVEDRPEMARYLQEILSPHFNCDLAFNGMEGWQALQKRTYDLIISDLMMPVMDGMSLRRKVNSEDRYKNIPFIFLTAKNQAADRLSAFDLGVDDYIIKPFSPEELQARIQALLDKKKEREKWVREHLDFLDDSAGSEEKLMQKINAVILENLSNEAFRVADLADEVAYSQRQLSRLLKKLTGLSPVRYILELRLQRAYLCLKEKRFDTISELRYHVGISSAGYFNRKFRERFGVPPSEL